MQLWKNAILYLPLPEDISSQERKANALLDGSVEPTQPYLCNVSKDRRETLAVFWRSESDDRRHFYPVSAVNCEEFDDIHPIDWDVIFLGSAPELKATGLTKKIRNLPALPPEKIFCLLAVKSALVGFNEQDITGTVFLCLVDVGSSQGTDSLPKSFCRENWQPASDQLPPYMAQPCQQGLA